MVFLLKKIEVAKTIGLIISIIIILFLIIYIFISKIFYKIDNDYSKLGLDIKYYEIKYYTVFEDDIFEKYKVYKISNRSMEELRR